MPPNPDPTPTETAMLVHRLLDAFFRTLDTIDAVRDRVDRLRGREPQPDPWAVEWPPAEPDQPNGRGSDGEARLRPVTNADEASTAGEVEAKDTTKNGDSRQRTAKTAKGAKKAGQAKKAAAAPKKASARPKPIDKATPKGGSASRKGSVDRAGKDFDSPRARAVLQYIEEHKTPVVTEEADVGGKKVLARVLWALRAAEDAGSEMGLTTADASALLHLAADIEVFATNIGRACRDHGDFIVESTPDGRSKRYRLTEEGRKQADAVETRAP